VSGMYVLCDGYLVKIKYCGQNNPVASQYNFIRTSLRRSRYQQKHLSIFTMRCENHVKWAAVLRSMSQYHMRSY
jgi:hypothetical protein